MKKEKNTKSNYYDRLLQILGPLREVIEEIAAERNGDDVSPEFRGQPAAFAEFDAGHLCAAETIILAAIPSDYEGLTRYREAESERKLRKAITAMTVQGTR